MKEINANGYKLRLADETEEYMAAHSPDHVYQLYLLDGSNLGIRKVMKDVQEGRQNGPENIGIKTPGYEFELMPEVDEYLKKNGPGVFELYYDGSMSIVLRLQ